MRIPVRLLALLGFLLLGRLAWATTPPTAGRPLAEVLNADGTLKPGMAGSFDPRGYELVDVAGSRQPTFRPVEAKRTQGAGDEKWRSGFGLPGVDGPVYAVAKAPNGDIYVGGDFSVVGTNRFSYIARWDGSTWTSPSIPGGSSLVGIPYALAVGSTGLLYAGIVFADRNGTINHRVMCWDGSTWSRVGADMDDPIRALAVTADGTLYAGGAFDYVGGTYVSNLARWNGSSWSYVGVSQNVNALVASGNTLFISTANVVLRYSAGSLTTIGTVSNSSFTATTESLAVDGTGAVYAGGNFTSIDGTSASNLARWNGSTWSALGAGLPNTVTELAVASDNLTVYAGGNFSGAAVGNSGLMVVNVSRWNGTTWSLLGTGFDYDTGGPAQLLGLALDNADVLYAVGRFQYADGLGMHRVARWNGTAWNSLTSGLDASILSLAIAPDGTVYAGGTFVSYGNQRLNRVARWDGSTWQPLGTGMNNRVSKLLLDANGNLYAGGDFTTAGGLAAKGVARWNGTAWSGLGPGPGAGVVTVNDIALAPNGDLYAGGLFNSYTTPSIDNIARWDGSVWRRMGSGIRGTVLVLMMNPSGQLYVGGNFNMADLTPAGNLAMWDTNTLFWFSTPSPGVSGSVSALLQDGSGALFIGGSFSSAGGVSANNIVRFYGGNWNPLGTGANGPVQMLQQDDVGNVYASGNFERMNGIDAPLAKWDGTSWSSAFGSGLAGVQELLISNNRVYAGGGFTTVGDRSKVVAYFGIYDINTAPTLTAQSFTLPENSANGTAVGTVQATGSGLSYSITAGNPGGAFAINSSTGALTVANAAALDYETTPSFALTVQVTDGTTPATATVTVNLTDVDEVRPTVSISSPAGATGSSTGTTPIPFTVTFSESVTGFVPGDVTVTGGSIVPGSLTVLSASTYTIQVTPTSSGSTVTVNVPINVAQDAAGNFNTAAAPFAITYQQPVVAVAQTVTVNLAANGTATLNASSVNNGSTGSGTLTYTIQKIARGRVAEGSTLTLTTPNGANFTQIRFASYGTPTDDGNDNYTLGSCNAANSVTTAQNSFIGRSSGSMDAANGPGATSNTPQLGNPCGSTGKFLAVQAGYSADAASLSYTCPEASQTNYVLLTVTDGSGATSTSVAQVTVNPSPTATISSLSPDPALPGETVTVSGTNLGSLSAVTFGGTAVNIGNNSPAGFTFQVPAGAASGNLVVTLPCAQTLTQALTVTQTTAAPVLTTPAHVSLTNDNTPTYEGTAPANSTVTVRVDNSPIGTTTATAGGTFALTQPTALADGTHTVNARAQSSGSAVSAVSNTNGFTVDATAPTVTLTSADGASGSTTPNIVFSFTATFSEPVTGFTASDIFISNGVVSSGPVAGPGNTYTFTITPMQANVSTAVRVEANGAQDAAGNGNPATAFYYIELQLLNVTWNGSQSSDWFTRANWTPAFLPRTSHHATIAGNAPNMPVIADSTAHTDNLTINNNATLTMTGGTLNVIGDLTNNGTFTPTGGTVLLGAVRLSSVLGSSRVRFWNLQLNGNSVQLSTSVGASVRRLLTLNSNLRTNGNPFVIESDATGTALVFNKTSTVIIGNVTVQRYISPANPGLGYRHYSAPVSSATVGSLATAAFSPVMNPAYNSSATPGFATPFPTVYGYDETRLGLVNDQSFFNKGWYSPAAPGTALIVGQGYSVNIGGGQTFAVTGPANNGTYSQTLTRGPVRAGADGIDQSGWHLVGNPYPAPLDYSLVAAADRPNLDAAIYIFESNSQYGGNYRSYVNGVGGDPVLAQGQGFFARVSTGQTSGSLTFRNSQRVTSYANPTYRRSSSTRPLVQLDLQSATGSDPLYVYFEQGATAGTDPEFDALKLPNTSGLNLSAVAGNDEMSINGLPLPTGNLTVPLQVRVPATGSYTLHAESIVHLPVGMVAYLHDRQTGALQDLSQQPDYTFQLNAAYMGVRFELFFSPQRVTATAPASLSAQVAVFPNPAHKAVFVELPATLTRSVVQVALVDALGRTVLTQSLTAASTQLSLEGVAAGVYAVRLQTAQGTVTKKLTVE